MKRIFLSLMLIATSIIAFGQNSTNKFGFGVGVSGTDFTGPVTGQYFMFDRHRLALNLSVGKYMSKSFDSRLNFTYGETNVPYTIWYDPTNGDRTIYQTGHMFDLGLNFMFKLNNGSLLKENSRFAPYLYTGLGANYLSGEGRPNVHDDFNMYVPLGIGMNIRLAEKWSLGLDAGYKFVLDNSLSYTQSTIKLIKNFGGATTADATAASTTATATPKAPKVKKVKTPKVETASATTSTTTTNEPASSMCNHNWSVYAGMSMVDFQTPITGQPFMFERYKSMLSLGVMKYLNKSFNGRLGIGYGNVWHPRETSYRVPSVPGDMVPATMWELQFDLMYKFNNGKLMKEDAVFAPYIAAGLGANSITEIGNTGIYDDVNTFFAPALGFNFRTSDRFTLNLEAGYKFNIDNSYDYSNAAIRGVYHLGKCKDGSMSPAATTTTATPAATAKVDDADGDGIADLVDECPFVAGKAEFFGCPDSDNDNIGDSRDKCPFEAGTLEASGCPAASKVITMEIEDADNDGIADADDLCPDEAGPVANNGCPSTDVAKAIDPAADAAKATADAAAKAAADAAAKATNAVTKATTPTTKVTTKATTKTTTPVVAKTTKTLAPPPAAVSKKVVEKYVAPVETSNQKLIQSFTVFMSNGTVAAGQIETLQAVSALLKANPNYIVRLNGFAVNTNKTNPDMDKSIAYAQKVLGALSMKGVEIKRTKLVGYGGDRPKFAGKEQSKNNRVELEVYSFE